MEGWKIGHCLFCLPWLYTWKPCSQGRGPPNDIMLHRRRIHAGLGDNVLLYHERGVR